MKIILKRENEVNCYKNTKNKMPANPVNKRIHEQKAKK